MFTHQSPAIPSRYSVPSASTTVEPRPSTITIGSVSSCRCGTTGWSTFWRSLLTTVERPSGSVISSLLGTFGVPLFPIGSFRIRLARLAFGCASHCRILDGLPNAFTGRGHVQPADAERRQRVDDGVHDGGERANRAGLA